MDFIDHRSTANFIFSLSATDEKFRITNNGDVGIGTSSPSTKLEVNGVITTAGLTTTADINFGDNDKAIFGAGSDLQIYHDGSHSYVTDAGTGHLKLQGTNLKLQDVSGNNYIDCIAGSYVRLMHNASTKLETTSTGIDITGNATFADNGKAIFGAGSDLQIYHDGSNSFIDDQGTGSLVLQSNGAFTVIQNSSGVANARFDSAGAASLRYNGAEKLATTSTGIDVTGNVVSDGLTVDGTANLNSAVTITSTSAALFFMESDTTDLNTRLRNNGGNFAIHTVDDSKAAVGLRFNIDNSTGDISFYEDTGTTAKLFWDASAESLGINDTSPARRLSVNSGGVQIAAKFESSSTTSARIGLVDGNTTADNYVNVAAVGDAMALYAGAAERFRITSGGNVGIGTTSPLNSLHIQDSVSQKLLLTNDDFVNGTTGTSFDITFGATSGNTYSEIRHLNNGRSSWSNFVLARGGGNVGIGTSSPDTLLHLSDTAGGAVIRLERNDTSIVSTDVYGEIQFEGQDASAGSAAGIRGKILGVAEGATGEMALAFQTASGYSSSTERMRIDSSGNVGIGTSSPDCQLELSKSSTSNYTALKLSNTSTSGTGARITFESTLAAGTFEAGHIRGATNSFGNGGLIFEYNTSGTATGSTEAMRIDSSGNLLVGTTDDSPFNNSAGSAADNGLALKENGQLQVASYKDTANSGAVVYLNRTSTDGNIIDFRKDGSTVGSIGTSAGRLGVDSEGSRLNLQLSGTTKAYVRSSSLNPSGDNTFDLGESSERFKDLYLSGGTWITGSVPRLNLNDSDGTNTIGEIRQLSGTIIIKSRNGTSNGVIRFSGDNGTTETEHARFDASGNFLVGKTSADNTTQGIRFLGSSGFMSIVRSNDNLVVLNRIDGDGTIMEFRTNGTTQGSISISGSTTSYNTSSDQRLKDNIVDAPSASDDIDAIQVRSFDWKADGSHQKYGMVAQELQNVAPEAVTGDADSDDMMGVDYSKLVPMMLKEIQSLRARVAQLEGEN